MKKTDWKNNLKRRTLKTLKKSTGNNPVFQTFDRYDYIAEVNYEGTMTLCYITWYYDDNNDEVVEYCRVVDDPRFSFNWTATVDRDRTVRRSLGYRWIASGFREEVLKG